MAVSYLSDWQDPPGPDTVLCFEVEEPDVGSTITIGHGRRERDGCMVRFAGDPLDMRAIAAAIRDTGEPVPCEVPAYAVLDISRPESMASHAR